MTYINLLYLNMKDPNDFEIHKTIEEESFEQVVKSFEDINLDNEDIYFQDLPSIYTNCVENRERIAIFVLNSLNVGEFETRPYIDLQYGKFENIYIRSGKSSDEIIRDLERNSNNIDFIEFIRNHINTNIDFDNKEDVWKEIISCAIVYSLNDKTLKDFIGPFSKFEISYDSVREYFGVR